MRWGGLCWVGRRAGGGDGWLGGARQPPGELGGRQGRASGGGGGVVRCVGSGGVGGQGRGGNVGGAVGADIGHDVLAHRGRRIVGAVEGNGDVLQGRSAVTVGHRNQVVLGQGLALGKEL